MIALLPRGAKGSPSLASVSVLSKVVNRYQQVRKPLVVPDLNIDGGVGLSLERRKSLPVILLPLLSECGDAVQKIVDAISGLQQASLEFRVVVVTDMPSFKELRSYGWAITHVQAESERSQASWLEYAQNEIDRIIKAFGCSYVVETSESGISARSWSDLLSLAQLGPNLPNTSLNAFLSEAPVRRHSSWRGWLSQVPSGESSHEVEVAGIVWGVEVSHRVESSMVFVSIDGEHPRSPRRRVPQDIQSSWSSVRLFPESGESRLGGYCADGVKAVFDGLSLHDTGILELCCGLCSDYVSLPSSVVRTSSVTELDVPTAYRRALSVWSGV